MTVAEPVGTARTAGRVFLIDEACRVLFAHERIDVGSGQTHWITPGGGLEGDETPAQGAMREVLEETGLRVDLPLWADAVYIERDLYRLAGTWWDQTNHYFLARVACQEIEPTHQTELERQIMLGFRWWSLDELASTAERVKPPCAVEVIQRALDDSS
jgi:8-oxo-dGTP pyrophosphatase MutT (NUDIX family)